MVWLNREQAKLFRFSEDRMERHAFRTNESDEDLHSQIADKLTGTKKILILGSELAKNHFLNHLKDKHPILAKRVIACETADHASDQQIAEYARKYFQKPVA